MPPEVIAERSYYLTENPTSPAILLQLLRPDLPENDYLRCRLRLLIGAKAEETESAGSIRSTALQWLWSWLVQRSRG
jgi:hypothetical protein